MLIAQTEAEELPSVSVNPYFSFGPVTKAVSELKQQLNESSNDELVKVAKTGEREVSMFSTSRCSQNRCSRESDYCSVMLL